MSMRLPLLAVALLPLLAACAPRGARPRSAAAQPRCERYAMQVSNGSRGRVSVFSVPTGHMARSQGAFLGELSPYATGRFSLPPNSRSVVIQREPGVVPRQGDIQRKLVCDAS